MVALGYLLVVIFTAGIIISLSAVARARGFAEPPPVAVLVLMIFGFVTSLVAHEAGHWVAGLAVGWRGLRFRLGPYALIRASNGWRIRWVKRSFGGAVTFAPTSLKGYRKADAIFTAGGPAASMLFGAVCALVAWDAGNSIVFWVFGAMVLWSFHGILSLLPIGEGVARSDGYWLWQLARGGQELDRRQRYLLANMSHGTDLRPRDWPQNLMRPVLEGPTPGADRHGAYLAYIHLMDSGDSDAAFPWLDGVLKHWQKTDPPGYALEGAYYAGVFSNDAVVAAKWLGCAGTGADPWVLLRARAAVACAAGRAEESQRLAHEALATLEDVPPCGHRDYETARLQDLLRRNSACLLV